MTGDRPLNNDPPKHLSKRHWRAAVWLAAACLVLLSAGCLWFQAPLLGSGSSGPDSLTAQPYSLSIDQNDLVQELGYPEAFIILFYQEEAPDGSLVDVRQEVWEYYTAGKSYAFLDGELAGSEDLNESLPGPLAELPYIPEQFSAGMTLQEVIESAGLDDYIEVPLEQEFLEGGNLYYGDSLSFGLVDGELRYLEGLAVIEE